MIAPAVCALLLCGLTADRIMYHLPAGDPGPYHERIREAAEHIPYQVGDWIGTDEEVPKSAIALLKPNVVLGRRFENVRTGQHVSMLLVQCRDARDIGGHYPPRCYPSHGWRQDEAIPRDWVVEGETFPGMEYRFSYDRLGVPSEIVVYNFIIRPGGAIERTTRGLREAAADRRKKLFGGGQFQLVFQGDTTHSQRDEILAELLPIVLPVIFEIRSGIES
jgi:hypothetical protein